MKTNEKIVLLVGSLNQGGAEFQLLSLAKLLQSSGHDIEVMALTDYDYFLPFVQQHRIPYSCVSNEGTNKDKTRRAIRLLNSKKPALVISYIKKVSQVAIAARVLSGFRYKLIISERTSLIRPRHDLLYFNMALLANLLTVNSISKLRYIQQHFPLLKGKAVFMPNIIDIQKFATIRYTPGNSNPIRLSFVGRLSPEKNLLHLVRAVEVLVKKGYPLQLVLVGSGSNKAYVAQLNQLISDLQLQQQVQLRPAVDDVLEVYRHTDLLCLVSIFEGFSNVLSEAISSGIPVIASDIEENRYLVEDGENGFLADPSSYTSIAGAIERAVQGGPDQWALISANNKAKAKAIFDEHKIYQSYLDLFRKIGFKHSCFQSNVPVS